MTVHSSFFRSCSGSRRDPDMFQRLLRSREDVFADYHREGFEAAFGRHFRIEAAESVTGSERTMYAMTASGRA